MPVFDELCVWLDPVKRPGPEAMAVDEWLFENSETPVLRIYRWSGEWGSIGYFGKLATARAAFPEIEWVRRWTGGGVVDPRADWTYTIAAGSGITGLRGAESYRIMHAALAQVLQAEGIDARLGSGADESSTALCFEKPVEHDLVDATGRKLAGAGQRRTRRGLLHQGSVAAPCDVGVSETRSARLAELLSETWRIADLQPPRDWLDDRVRLRYGSASWTKRC
jgi:lipoate-protein ligase A